jgi:iron complex transport system ATP-binding protein
MNNDSLYLEARNLQVRLGGKEVLRSVNIEVRKGEFLALLGANGSGKTTLLHCLGRLRKPQSGSILWQGKKLHAVSTRHLARQLAILPQNPHAPMAMEVQSLVQMGRSPYRRMAWQKDPDGNEVVNNALRHMELEHLVRRKMGSLSGGERQRAWIAMAMAQNPDLLLLDEPTTFLDISHQLQVLEMLRRWKEQGNRSVVAVLHDLNHALRYADRIAVLHNGVIHCITDCDSALNCETLREAFGIEAENYYDTRANSRFLIAHLPMRGASVLC